MRALGLGTSDDEKEWWKKHGRYCHKQSIWAGLPVLNYAVNFDGRNEKTYEKVLWGDLKSLLAFKDEFSAKQDALESLGLNPSKTLVKFSRECLKNLKFWVIKQINSDVDEAVDEAKKLQGASTSLGVYDVDDVQIEVMED
jgi:hypothetical protein